MHYRLIATTVHILIAPEAQRLWLPVSRGLSFGFYDRALRAVTESRNSVRNSTEFVRLESGIPDSSRTNLKHLNIFRNEISNRIWCYIFIRSIFKKFMKIILVFIYVGLSKTKIAQKQIQRIYHHRLVVQTTVSTVVSENQHDYSSNMRIMIQ